MMHYFRYLLLPFSWIYGLAVIARNYFYDAGIFKSTRFNLPVIVIGNLEVGGAGKSPMTEFLISLLQPQYKIATLSRGYGRQTKGFFYAGKNSMAKTVGDEPLQFKQKFPDITVAVCESRVEGVEKLQAENDLVLLDDAYQHRALKPGFSILLFDYSKFNQPHFMLPAGNYREPFSGRKRADVIVISKCPQDLSTENQQQMLKKVKLKEGQQLFFTSIVYHPFRPLSTTLGDASFIGKKTTLFVLTGIANPKPLLQNLRKQSAVLIHHKYPDHHQFTIKNISKLVAAFKACAANKKAIITTEKDAQRLQEPALQNLLAGLPVFVAPIGLTFLNDTAPGFKQLIENYVRKYQKNNRIHTE
ncbi:tetraacyldisaccharide 4'-kinase [Mucilaginibacter arboris]|uniref:Tetraacyldisaccharide 4'-kinase n=1 Tax=Mucilaginibacter arboris TaxID=2682090 RepID=A0A7K1STA4_9SPHI|nr:tetraacyldisaccharide 4'-kinase [Mucilaginibacter arboris]MVN20525.1 tetraacyldisaccharide 4'-kinase [Mucilaginibacter arboris]